MRFAQTNNRLLLRTMSVAATTKKPISALPLPPEHLLLTKNLTPDAEIPNPSRFLEILKEKPSIQRRSRAISAQSHFSFTSPLPVQFPYRFQPPDPPPTDEERPSYIERKLAELEPLEEQPLSPTSRGSCYKKFASGNRDPERVLVGLSEAGVRDCVPGLDTGDALSIIGRPSLLPSEVENEPAAATPEGIAARQDLVDILSGRSMLVPFDENGNPASGPWSLRYSGHQFGTWAGQLGDGRAISVCESAR
jgi:serine/tyrosine/threonine adenylyltransferase